MKRTGFLKVCSKLMAFVLTAGITVGAFVADPGNDMLVSAKDGNGDIVVVLDPGHGGYDGGAHSSITGDDESNLNWNIAKYRRMPEYVYMSQGQIMSGIPIPEDPTWESRLVRMRL